MSNNCNGKGCGFRSFGVSLEVNVEITTHVNFHIFAADGCEEWLKLFYERTNGQAWWPIYDAQNCFPVGIQWRLSDIDEQYFCIHDLQIIRLSHLEPQICICLVRGLTLLLFLISLFRKRDSMSRDQRSGIGTSEPGFAYHSETRLIGMRN